MAGTIGADNGPKAKARHEKIANERKEAQIKAKQKVEDDRWKVRFAEERRKEEIKKLPREERAEAKRQLKEQIRHRKAVEREQKLARRAEEQARAEKERKEAQMKAAGIVAHEEQKVEEAIQASERQEGIEEIEVEQIAEGVQEVLDPTPAEEGVPGEIPVDEVPAKTVRKSE